MGEGKELLRKAVELINTNEKSKERMSGWKAIIQFELEGEKGPFHLVFKGQNQTDFVDSSHEAPTVTLRSDTNTIAKIYKGEEDIVEAFFAKKLRVEGPLPEAQKFQGIILPALES
ncbi:MAG: SCP2 sterol-binding domain-containing protein [Candidatus Heimdallarchaeota archaeon]